MKTSLLLKGAPGSPYTRKMLALLRYRHIPYRLLSGAVADRLGLPRPTVELLPTFYLPNADGVIEAVTDSTPLICRFEREWPGRQVRPDPPALRFIDSLLEDFADEWVTKAMFHYRWSHQADIQKAGDILPLQYVGICASEAMVEGAKAQFSQRQIRRLAVVGSSAQTAPIIEAAYLRLVGLLDAHLRHHPFLMGQRPGTCDFALYGQLTQLAQFDPTPMALTLAHSRRLLAWVGWMEDLSGLDPRDEDWLSAEALPDTLLALLGELGRAYVPLMLANARALLAGARELTVEIDGQTWTQQTVSYQGKCLRWLREEYAELTPSDQATVRNCLKKTGCMALMDAPLTAAGH
jgi:glutathione S-transferase